MTCWSEYILVPTYDTIEKTNEVVSCTRLNFCRFPARFSIFSTNAPIGCCRNMSFWHSIFKTSDTSAVDVLYLQRWNFYTSTSNVNLCCIGHVYNWPFLKHQSSLAQYLYLYRDFKNIHIILKNKHVLIWRRPAPWFLLTTKWQNIDSSHAWVGCGGRWGELFSPILSTSRYFKFETTKKN